MTYTAWGIDYAYGSGLTTATMKQHGVQFVARYTSGGNSKDLSVAEKDNLLAAGINIVLCFETDGLMPSYAQGASDARVADAEVKRLGLPGIPIYFTLDTDPHAYPLADVSSYLSGVASVIGLDRTGLYGGYLAVNQMFNAGKIKWAWQTYAWSYGAWDSRAQLQQWNNSVALGPATVDQDRATTADYGQWPRPAPPKPPAPTPGKTWTADGSTSLQAVAAANKAPISTVLRWTLEKNIQFSAGLSSYIQGADLTKPIPKGVTLVVSSPKA